MSWFVHPSPGLTEALLLRVSSFHIENKLYKECRPKKNRAKALAGGVQKY